MNGVPTASSEQYKRFKDMNVLLTMDSLQLKTWLSLSENVVVTT
jgi:hypothetical protein